MGYANFLRILLVLLVAASIVVANATSNYDVLMAIVILGISIEILCIVRLRKLGYSLTESLRLLIIEGEKLAVFFNRVDYKVN